MTTASRGKRPVIEKKLPYQEPLRKKSYAGTIQRTTTTANKNGTTTTKTGKSRPMRVTPITEKEFNESPRGKRPVIQKKANVKSYRKVMKKQLPAHKMKSYRKKKIFTQRPHK